MFWGIINFCLKWFEQLSQCPCTDVQYPVCGCVSRFFLEIVKWTSQFLHTWLTWVKSNQWQLWVYTGVIIRWYANEIEWLSDWSPLTDITRPLNVALLQTNIKLWFKTVRTNALSKFIENKTTPISNLNIWNRIHRYWKLWLHILNGLNLTLFVNIKFPPIPNCNF